MSDKPKVIRQQVQVSYDDIIRLIQGHKLSVGFRLSNDDVFQVDILSPLEGVYLSVEEMGEIRADANLLKLYK